MLLGGKSKAGEYDNVPLGRPECVTAVRLCNRAVGGSFHHHRDAGNRFAHAADGITDQGGVPVPVHRRKDLIGDVLDREIHIFQELWANAGSANASRAVKNSDNRIKPFIIYYLSAISCKIVPI